MRVLVLHNRYRQAGGEDQVFKAETVLLKSKGIEVETLEFNNDGGISPLKLIHNPDSIKRFRQVVNAFKPEILHVHNLFLKASPAILRESKKMNLPVVMTLHNYRLICANALLMRNGKVCEKCVSQKFPISGIIHNCYRNSKVASIGMATTTNFHRLNGTWKNCVQKYIALTQFGKDKILSSTLGLQSNQIIIKPNFLVDPSSGKSKRENKFLFVGRLSEEKGIRTLLDAHKSEKFELEIIGDGPLKELVEKASRARDSLTYKGNCDRTIVLKRMESVQGLIVPSIWYEGCPMTVIESFACKTPVIASNIGALSNLVSHDKNGKLFKAGDSEALLEQILNFPKNESWNKVSENARNSYLTKYSPEVNFQELMQIYEQVIQEFNQ
jgi:glycosyltransferase involved in cell wall biosynthesis